MSDNSDPETDESPVRRSVRGVPILFGKVSRVKQLMQQIKERGMVLPQPNDEQVKLNDWS